MSETTQSHVIGILMSEGVSRSDAELISDMAEHAKNEAFKAVFRVLDAVPRGGLRNKSVIVTMVLIEAQIEYIKTQVLDKLHSEG